MSEPVKGERRFRVWAGNMSGTVWAGMMVYDGKFWVSTGKRHDVTDDVLALNGLDELRT